ncbi:hypothetical protein ACFYKX_11005 [Cytobacillus sp. FJAT-54145]|uniref:Uncharacterized protein n=1 Tax=Cytobacillus spartinae TaxID=3299023 RepID=A0ABW6KC13_9BACI
MDKWKLHLDYPQIDFVKIDKFAKTHPDSFHLVETDPNHTYYVSEDSLHFQQQVKTLQLRSFEITQDRFLRLVEQMKRYHYQIHTITFTHPVSKQVSDTIVALLELDYDEALLALLKGANQDVDSITFKHEGVEYRVTRFAEVEVVSEEPCQIANLLQRDPLMIWLGY